jgi:hypothetical protein
MLCAQLISSLMDQGTIGMACIYRKLHKASGRLAYCQSSVFLLKQKGDIEHRLISVGLVLLYSPVKQNLKWDELTL